MLTIDKENDVEMIFNTSLVQSAITASKVASAWFQFSKFVPSFLEEIVAQVDDSAIKRRIYDIIEEERGGGAEETNHSNLYKNAAKKIDIEIEEREISSIAELQSVSRDTILNCEDSEAFVVGVAYGLEFIAEENIAYLLHYTSKNLQDISTLSKTSFFTIHFKNEVDHIEMCEDNVRIVTADSSRRELFFDGFELSRNFWKKFWNEAIS